MSDQEPPVDGGSGDLDAPADLPSPGGPPADAPAGDATAVPVVAIGGDDVPPPPPPGAQEPRPARAQTSKRPVKKRAVKKGSRPSTKPSAAPAAATAAAASPSTPAGSAPAGSAPAGSAPSTGSAGSASAKRRPAGPVADEEPTSTRGVLIIVATVIVGLLVFWQGLAHKETPVETTATSMLPGITTSSVDKDAAPTTTSPSQGTVVKPVTTKVAPADVKVLVANGVDPSQVIAGPVADELTQAGYTVTGKTDLSTTSASSFVYYTGDLQPEAVALAKVLGLPDSAVVAMPTPAPTTLGSAEVLVVIGKDRP